MRAALVGAAGVVCALALGGLGYAAVGTVAGSANTTSPTPIPGTTLSQPTTAITTTSSSSGGGTRSVPAEPGHPGSLGLKPAGGGTVLLHWSASTFTQPATITADPDPALGVTLTGARNQLVGVVAVNGGGKPVRAFAAPFDVIFGGVRRGNVPVATEDGKHFHQLVRLKTPHLAKTQSDGYFVTGSGKVEILSKHLTIFGVLAAENHAKWGDTSRPRTKPPVLRVLGITTAGQVVTFTLSVDEPVALVLRATVPLAGETTIGARTLGGPPSSTKLANLVRGGLFRVTIHTARVWTGKLSIVLTAADNNGNRAVRRVAAGSSA
ncbi:MAG: hypothetical protein ACYDCH_07470 [Gaiellaceae bacterium]